MTESAHVSELTREAMTIIGRGCNCGVEIDEGAGWEPRLLAFRTATESDVATALRDLLETSPTSPVRLASYDGRLRRMSALAA